jgi:hypothetical protein
MPVAGGLNSQLGYKAETTWGTAVTVDRFAEFDSESLKLDIERVEHMGLRPTRRVLGANNWQPSRKSVSGDIEKVIQTKGDALWFAHALGAVATTTPSGGSTSRSHKCTVGAIDGKGLTIQVGRTSTDGTTRAFTYAGCKIPSWEISGEENDWLKATFSIDGKSETTATALASASYPTGLSDYVWTQAVLSIAGSEVPVKGFSLSGENNLDTERFRLRSTTPAEKLEQLEGNGMREYSGSITADFTDLTAYNRFVNGTMATLTIVYTGAIIEGVIPYSFTVSCPDIRFDGETPTVGGPEMLEQSLPFKVVDDSEADGPVVITVVNTDTAP